MDTEKKRALEADVMEKMIAIYCRGKKHAARTRAPQEAAALCPDCRRLLAYARERVVRCPRLHVKSFCSPTCASRSAPSCGTAGRGCSSIIRS